MSEDFIESLHHLVRQSLTEAQAASLRLDPSTPFASDAEFLALSRCLADFKIALCHLRNTFQAQSLQLPVRGPSHAHYPGMPATPIECSNKPPLCACAD
jgi:hypothetical protein